MSRAPRPGDAPTGAAWDDGRQDEHRGRTDRPPDRVPIDVDAARTVAIAIGVITWPRDDAEEVIADALDIHASGYSGRALTYVTETRPVASVEQWDAIVAVAELVGRRKLEDGAP